MKIVWSQALFRKLRSAIKLFVASGVKLFVPVIAGLLLTGAGSVFSQALTARDYLELAVSRGVARDYDGALENANKGIELQPLPELYFIRGLARHYKHDFVGADVDYEKAAELKFDALDFHLERGKTLFMLKEYKRSLASFRRALELDPKSSDGLVGRGLARTELGDPVGGISDYTAALEVGKPTDFIYGRRARNYRRTGNLPAAIDDYGKAIELNPKEIDYFLDRGELFLRTGRDADAERDFAQAIRMQPSSEAWLRGVIEEIRKERKLPVRNKP